MTSYMNAVLAECECDDCSHRQVYLQRPDGNYSALTREEQHANGYVDMQHAVGDIAGELRSGTADVRLLGYERIGGFADLKSKAADAAKKGGDAAKKAGDASKKAAAKAGEAGKKAAEAGKEAAKKAGEAGKKAAQDALEKTEKYVEEAKEKTGPKAKELKDKAKGLLDSSAVKLYEKSSGADEKIKAKIKELRAMVSK